MAGRPPVIVFHASPDLVAKLDALTRIAGRPRSVVLRLLVARATPDDLPTAWRVPPPDDEREVIALAEGRALS